MHYILAGPENFFVSLTGSIMLPINAAILLNPPMHGSPMPIYCGKSKAIS
jgi:hypothetical protein